MELLWYYTVAVVLSLAWWPVLQLNLNMRKLLWAGALESNMAIQLLLFAVTGLLVAGLFRSAILRAKGGWNLLLGAVLPFVGAEIFAFLLGVYSGGREMAVGMFWAPLFTLQAFYVVIPFGVGAQFAMRWAGGGPLESERTWGTLFRAK
jgi:hypothetical protein